MLFFRLTPVPRKRLLAYIDAPSYKEWVEIRDMIVAPGLTLLDVIEQVTNHSYDVAGPNAIQMAQASRAVDQRWSDLSAMEI